MECCICHKEIADCIPPLCDNEECEERYMVEVKFNKWAKEQAKKFSGNSKWVFKKGGV